LTLAQPASTAAQIAVTEKNKIPGLFMLYCYLLVIRLITQ
jgi:hypothetical protein